MLLCPEEKQYQEKRLLHLFCNCPLLLAVQASLPQQYSEITVSTTQAVGQDVSTRTSLCTSDTGCVISTA